MNRQLMEQKDKVMLVTGASSGIGLAVATALAETGATVVLLARDQQRGGNARHLICERTQNRNVHLLLADLADLDSVAQCAAGFREQYSRLDVLVNNAGVIVPERRETRQGLELQFGVNHIGHFLLTCCLEDLLVRTPAARVVVVASGAHKVGRIHFDDINLEKKYSVIRAYAQSKLANILFTRSLSRRLDGQDVAVNCCHPGAVATNIGVNRRTGQGRRVVSALKPFIQTPEMGAATAVALALTPLGEKNEGRYYHRFKPAKVSRLAMDDVLADQLWQLSEQLVAPWRNKCRQGEERVSARQAIPVSGS